MSVFAGIGAAGGRGVRKDHRLPSHGSVSPPSRHGAAPVSTFGIVPHGPDLDRVLRLPRRSIDFDQVPDINDLVRKPGGTMRLKPIQSAALIEASLANGLFAPIAVGAGKTLISLLLPAALNSKKTVLLVPPELRNQLHREARSFYGPHFEIPFDVIKVVAYSELSSINKADILEQIEPDLIVCDEAHRLKNLRSARTKRFMRYIKRDEVRLCVMSGTMTKRSLMDYWHLIVRCFYKNAPMPLNWDVAKQWANALDAKPDMPWNAGALKALCAEGETPRDGYKRRLHQSLGVVATTATSFGGSLLMRRLTLELPPAVTKLYQEVAANWSLDGDEFDSAARRAQYLKQIACGYYYRWAWPNDIVDTEWLTARTNWNRFVRDTLEHSRKGLDSPLEVYRACARYGKKVKNEKLPVINSDEWRAWVEVEDRPKPPTVPVWIDEFLVDASVTHARTLSKNGKKKPIGTILWFDAIAYEAPFRRRGIPVYGAGTDSSESKSSSNPVIACSIMSQSTGKNLQFQYSRNVVINMPASGVAFEQMAGRTHRDGQEADEVLLDWYGYSAEQMNCYEQVIRDAEYQQESGSGEQKILIATKIMF